MAVHVVARVAELPPGERRIVEIEGRSIGVFNVDGEFHALRNTCPHQGAPLCRGSLNGTARSSRPGEYQWVSEGEVLRCPWHGWEFDLTTGRSLFDPEGTRVRRYPLSVRDGLVLVEL
jgi:nitrite reductase/ring-hydroxylating ferredoxin subunit